MLPTGVQHTKRLAGTGVLKTEIPRDVTQFVYPYHSLSLSGPLQNLQYRTEQHRLWDELDRPRGARIRQYLGIPLGALPSPPKREKLQEFGIEMNRKNFEYARARGRARQLIQVDLHDELDTALDLEPWEPGVISIALKRWKKKDDQPPAPHSGPTADPITAHLQRLGAGTASGHGVEVPSSTSSGVDPTSAVPGLAPAPKAESKRQPDHELKQAHKPQAQLPRMSGRVRQPNESRKSWTGLREARPAYRDGYAAAEHGRQSAANVTRVHSVRGGHGGGHRHAQQGFHHDASGQSHPSPRWVSGGGHDGARSLSTTASRGSHRGGQAPRSERFGATGDRGRTSSAKY